MKQQRLGMAALLLVGFVLVQFIAGTVGFSVKAVNEKALVEGGSNPARLV